MTTTEKAPVTTDPLGDLDYYGRDVKRRHGTAWRELRGVSDGTGCNARNSDEEVENYVGEAGRFSCSRPTHPDNWKHIATYDARLGGYVIGYWGGAPDEPETEVDPEPAPFDLEIGTLYKFRNRPTMLMLIGIRPADKVEVLDLSHSRYRVLDRVQLIPRAEDAEPLTAGQLKWVATFMAERRNKVREVAIQQRRDGYFKSAADLNGVLTELGLEPHRPTRTGRLQPELDIRTKGMDDNVARRLLTKWFNELPPLPPGIEFVGKLTESQVYLNMRDSDRR